LSARLPQLPVPMSATRIAILFPLADNWNRFYL
jgi:hypothetical protein